MATTIATGTTNASRATIASECSSYAGARFATGLLGSGYTVILGGTTIDGAGTKQTIDLLTLFAITSTTVTADGSLRYGYEWRRPSAPILAAHFEDTQAVTLTDAGHLGKVLAIGGHTNLASAQNNATLVGHIRTPAEVFTAIPTGVMSAARGMHRATVLQDSKVLVSGGFTTWSTPLATAERWTPTTEAWTSAGSMAVARMDHAQALLADGRVLACGGLSGVGAYIAKCEVYTPGSNTWAVTGPMTYARAGHAALVLPSGDVVVMGGTGAQQTRQDAAAPLRAVEIYHPATGRWRTMESMPAAIARPTAVYVAALNSILVTGGDTSGIYLFNVTTGRWRSSLASLARPRRESQAVVLPNGAILLAGGEEFISSIWTTTEHSSVITPGAETIGSGRINLPVQVTSIPSATQVTFQSDLHAVYQAANGTLTPVAAPSVTYAAAHIVDPAGVAVTEIQASCGVVLESGRGHAALTLATSFADPTPALRFPDSDGWLVLRFGREGQIGPVRYFGRLSETELRLDASTVFSATVQVGDDVTLLSAREAFVPDGPALGFLYATASPSGRVAASRFLDDVVAAGVSVERSFEYPGDVGLGGEGAATSGEDRLSSIVTCYAGNDIDQELTDAREST